MKNIGIPLVTIGDVPIVMPLQKTLYTTLLWENLMQYLARKANINHPDIHWNAFARARRSLTIIMNIFVSKWISDTVPTGKFYKGDNIVFPPGVQDVTIGVKTEYTSSLAGTREPPLFGTKG
jgi:hypothetical protein